MPEKIAILFDLDGTLIHSLPDIAGVLNMLRGELNLEKMPEALVKPFIGKGAESLIRGCFPHVESDSRRESLVRRYRELYAKNPSLGGSLYDGVAETLRVLRGHPGVKLAVVTNKPQVATERSLSVYLPGFRFDKIACPENVTQKKPSPEHVLQVIQELQVSPNQTWLIGDDDVDAQCAATARIHFLAAAYGFGGVQAPKEFVLSSFPELLKKIPLPTHNQVLRTP